jgi:hypothetical protein
MFGDDEPGAESNPSPRTTIVGGRPPDEHAPVPQVPTGMQTLLRLASVDPKFRDEFVQRRDGIAEAAGVALTGSERRILAAVPAGQLMAMIARVPAPAAARRDFLRHTAATAVVLLGGAALSGSLSACNKPGAEAPPLNSSPQPLQQGPYAKPPPGPSPTEASPPRPDHNPMQTEGGAAPEPPPPRPDHNNMAPGGVRPDIEPPPAVPGTSQPTRGIRPDVPPEPGSGQDPF